SDLPISFHFTSERSDHLGVTAHTALTDIEVPAFQFQWRVRFYTGNGGDVGFHQNSGDNLDDSPDQNGDGGQNGQLDRLSFQPVVKGFPSNTIFGNPCQCGCFS